MKWLGYVFGKATCFCPSLAFVAGFLDAATFVRGGGVFCAHVTGNLIVIAAELIDRQRVAWLTAATLPTFIVTVIAVARTHRWLAAQQNEARARRAILSFEGTFIAFAWLLNASAHADELRAWIVLSLVIAMAAQTALQRLTPGFGAVTTVMTGNLAQYFMDLAALDLPNAQLRPRCHGRVIFQFLIGCAIGAATVKAFGFGVLLIPLCVLWRVARHDSEKSRATFVMR